MQDVEQVNKTLPPEAVSPAKTSLSTETNPTTATAASSSISVVSDTSKDGDVETKKKMKKKKSVSFASKVSKIVGYIPALKELSKQERRDVWLQARDFDAIKEAAKTASYDVRLLTRNGYDITHDIDNGYERAQYLAEIKGGNDSSLYDALDDTVRSDMCCFKSWTAHSETSKCRGLEQWVSSMYHESRRDVMKQSKRLVYKYQQRHETSEKIAKRYSDITRSSRVMARWLGHADQLAVIGEQKYYSNRGDYRDYSNTKLQCHRPKGNTTTRRRASMSNVETAPASPSSASYNSHSVLSDYFGPGSGGGYTNNGLYADDDLLSNASSGTESCQIRLHSNHPHRRRRGTNFFGRASKQR